MFYDRDIEGLWVTGEGIVYSDFDRNKHYFDDYSNITFKKKFAGVDWGYSHYGSIVVMGESTDGKFYLLEEHAYQFKEIDDWVEIAKEIKARHGNITFYCDSARPEHVDRFYRERLNSVNANKERLAGIEQVARLFKKDSLFINSNVKRFKEEIYNYIWDEKTGDTIKQFDDVLDSLRYAVYSYMNRQTAKVLNKARLGL